MNRLDFVNLSMDHLNLIEELRGLSNMLWSAGKIRSQSKSLEETSERHKTIAWIAKHDMANQNHKMNHAMVLKTNSATTNISPLHLSLNISKQFNSFSSQHVAMYHWCTSRSFHPVEPFLWKTQQGNSSFNVLEVMIYWDEMRDKLLANIALNFALQDYTSIV